MWCGWPEGTGVPSRAFPSSLPTAHVLPPPAGASFERKPHVWRGRWREESGERAGGGEAVREVREERAYPSPSLHVSPLRPNRAAVPRGGRPGSGGRSVGRADGARRGRPRTDEAGRAWPIGRARGCRAVDLVRYRLVRRRASRVGGGPAGQAGGRPVAEAWHDGAWWQPAQYE